MNTLTPNLFDYAAAQASRDAAIEQVTEGTSQWWMRAAIDAIRHCATSEDTFTTDDVWKEMAGVNQAGKDNRTMGAAMTQARRMGLIVPTSTFRNSTQASNHSRPVRVWRKA